MTTLANRMRPRRFTEVVGQESEMAVVKRMISENWKPAAILITGPFGTGKTTTSRLIARAFLCDKLEGVEPCGQCESCKAMDSDSNPGYTEIDAASNGLISDVRSMKDFVSYRTTGSKMKIICYDESHMLSTAAQNALLQTLEEGNSGVLYIFATTESSKMLPTIASRCIQLKMKLLTAGEIGARILQVAKEVNIEIEDRAAKIIASYVRGHVRDAMMFLEQMSRMAPKIDEVLVRNYLRLDSMDHIYTFLTLKTKKEGLESLESLLCNYALSELTDLLGTAMVNAYLLKQGLDNVPQVDKAWLQKIEEARGATLLPMAERIFTVSQDVPTIQYGMAALASILFEDDQELKGSTRSLMPGRAVPAAAPPPSVFRKPQASA